MPIISIIVPVYNIKKYINKCVDSILGQTFKDFELILVDDGSTDGSEIICDEYKSKDNRVKVIHKKNGGLSSARNIGIENSIGKYIGLIDGDDYIEKDMYEILYNDIEKNQADIAVCGVYDCYDKKLTFNKNKGNYMVINNVTALKFVLEGNYLFMYPVNKLYKRSLFDDIKYPEGKIFEDAFTTPILVSKANKVVYNPKLKYYYVHRVGSITTTNFSSKDLDGIEAYKSHIPMIENNFPQLKTQLTFRILWSYFRVLEKLLASKEVKYQSEYDKIVKVLKDNTKTIITNPCFSKRRKLMAMALKINENLYKKIFLFLNNFRNKTIN